MKILDFHSRASIPQEGKQILAAAKGKADEALTTVKPEIPSANSIGLVGGLPLLRYDEGHDD